MSWLAQFTRDRPAQRADLIEPLAGSPDIAFPSASRWANKTGVRPVSSRHHPAHSSHLDRYRPTSPGLMARARFKLRPKLALVLWTSNLGIEEVTRESPSPFRSGGYFDGCSLMGGERDLSAQCSVLSAQCSVGLAKCLAAPIVALPKSPATITGPCAQCSVGLAKCSVAPIVALAFIPKVSCVGVWCESCSLGDGEWALENTASIVTNSNPVFWGSEHSEHEHEHVASQMPPWPYH